VRKGLRKKGGMEDLLWEAVSYLLHTDGLELQKEELDEDDRE